MLKSPSKTPIFDFTEFAYSVQVTKDHPKLISIFEKLIPVLEKYQHYTAAWSVLQAAHDSKTLLEIQYMYYKHINDTKGQVR